MQHLLDRLHKTAMATWWQCGVSQLYGTLKFLLIAYQCCHYYFRTTQVLVVTVAYSLPTAGGWKLMRLYQGIYLQSAPLNDFSLVTRHSKSVHVWRKCIPEPRFWVFMFIVTLVRFCLTVLQQTTLDSVAYQLTVPCSLLMNWDDEYEMKLYVVIIHLFEVDYVVAIVHFKSQSHRVSANCHIISCSNHWIESGKQKTSHGIITCTI